MTALLTSPPPPSDTTQTATLCAHCSLPVPPGLIHPDEPHQFCCHGCATAFAIIHQCGLDRYYALRDADAPRPRPAPSTGQSYSACDDPAFLDLHAPLHPDGLRSTDFYLQGVHCSACVWLVEKLPRLLPGVLEARLNLGRALVSITWNPASLPLSRIARTLDSLGYPPHPARSASARDLRTADDRRRLVLIAVAGAAAGNAMLLGIALYAGLFSRMDPSYYLFFRWLSMAIGVLTLAWPGSVFFRGAWAALRTRTPHIDLPIALALAAGGIAGIFNTIANTGEIYFDSLSVLVFLLLVGRFLQHRQHGRAEDSLELLFSLTPSTAHRVTPLGTTDLPISSVQLADTLEVLPGESIPVDGTITSGQSAIDQSLLTGESLPTPVSTGDPVCAGTTNLRSPIRLIVQATGQSTRVGKLMRLVADCARRKAPIVLLADRIAGYFLIALLAITALTFAAWSFLDPATAGQHAVALLIVACPCALGLATPLSLSVAIARAARRGYLIKGGDTLQRLTRPGLLLLDKTGTLTFGRATLIHYAGDESLKPLIASVESHSTHPIARALVSALAPVGPASLPTATDIQQHPTGISARINGHTLSIGSVPSGADAPVGSSPAEATPTPPTSTASPATQSPINSINPINSLPPHLQPHLTSFLSQGLTPILITIDSQPAALAALGDALRPHTPHTLAALRKAGWTLGILSGDHPAIVTRLAQQLDIPPSLTYGGILPEQKLAIVQQHLAAGPVIMVGDGVNDAAALAAATVGIAVHGGAEASLAAADIYLGRPGLAPIVTLIASANQTMKTIRRGLAASLAYNLLAISLAAAGLIHPLVAAILMPLSSLTVLTLALSTRAFRSAPLGDAP